MASSDPVTIVRRSSDFVIRLDHDDVQRAAPDYWWCLPSIPLLQFRGDPSPAAIRAPTGQQSA
jgi:hypothetical protein